MALILTNLINYTCLYCFFTIFQIVIFREKGSLQDVSYFLLVFSIPRIVFSIFIGKYISKYDMKKIIILSHTALSILLFLLLFKHTIYFLLGITFIFSFFSQVYKISILSYIPRITEQRNLLKFNALLSSAEAMGIIIGPFISKFLINSFYKYSLFNFIGYISSVFLLIIFYYKNKNMINKKILKEEQKNIRIGDFFKLLYTKWNKINLVFIFLISLITALQGVMLIPYVTKILLKNEEEIGVLMSFQGTGMILIGFIGEKFLTNIKIKKLYQILSYSFGITAFSILGYLIFRNFFAIVLFFILIEGATVSLIYSCIYSLAQLFNKKNISEMFGAINMLEGFVYVAGTLFLPMVLNYVDVIYLYFGVVLLFIGLFLFVQLILKNVHLKFRDRR
ncbi:MAG: MFS transporter [Fusobacterium necrophorum]|nr:MFS transporter [Fusobacterium necrophorum]